MGNCISRKRGKNKDYEKVTAPKTPSKKEDSNSNADKAEARPKLENGSAEASNTKDPGEQTGLLEQENKQKERSEENNLKENTKEKAGKDKDEESKTGDEKKEEILKEKENEEAKENLEEKEDKQKILPKENKSHGLSTSWVVFEDTTLIGQEAPKETTIDNSGSCSKDDGDEVFQELVLENKDSEVKSDEESTKQIQRDTTETGVSTPKNEDEERVDNKKNDFVEKGSDEVKDDAATVKEPQELEQPEEQRCQNKAHKEDQVEIEAGKNTTPVFSEEQNTVEINEIRETGGTDKTEDKEQIKKDEGVPDETKPSQPPEANIEQGETEANSVEKRLEVSLEGLEEMARKSNTFIDMKKTVFLETRRDKKVLLQEMKIDGRKIHGIIAVIKSEAATEVKIRHTFDAWQSFSDTEARKINDADDKLADLFAFSLEVPSGKSLMFAISCTTKNGEFWDNNDGTNYGVENKKEGEDQKLSTIFITGKEEAFYDRLRSTHLCLENAFVFHGKGKISIGIEKEDEKNRKVGAKYTDDSWKTSTKVEANRQNHSSENLYDILTALIEVPKGTKKLDFAVFLEEGSAKFWDNNNGSNYSICLN